MNALKAFRSGRGERTEPEVGHHLADTYWMIFVLAGAAAIIASMGFGINEFIVPPPQETAGPTVGEGTANFDRTLLQASVKALKDRQVKFDALSH